LPASFEAAIVTKGSNCHIVGIRAVQEALDKLTAHFSSCACHKDALHESGLSGTAELVRSAEYNAASYNHLC
jgi:hypothetical protein